MNRYWSDTHFRHANILRYCERPFRDVEEMNEALFTAFQEAEAAGASLFHLGDFAFGPDVVLETLGGLEHPGRHTLIAGNHDKVTSKRPEVQRAYSAFFGRTIGTEKTWKQNTLLVEDDLGGRRVRLLLSHAPQQDLQGAHFNLYGHCHNTHVLHPERLEEEYPWLAKRHEKHFNVSVELIGYRPITLAELLERRAAGEALL